MCYLFDLFLSGVGLSLLFLGKSLIAILCLKIGLKRIQRSQNMSNVSDELQVIKRGFNELLVESELVEKIKNGARLKVKAGFDPTAPDLHLGHTVLLNKLRQLQNLGHQINFLIGDFTAMIGDPTGKNVTRPPLTKEFVDKNAETYKEQVFKILDEERTEVVFNSSWIEKMSPSEIIKLTACHTVARMLERDDFEKRYKSGEPIGIHEFLYPLIQGFDSVYLRSDLELGGADQKFNLLVGRELQKEYGQKPQCILTMPLLEGLDGVHKMSKSLGNYVGITDDPENMFGKLMSITDKLMWRYFELLSFEPLEKINKWREEVGKGKNPRDVKVSLASEIVERFHGKMPAKRALDEFESRFKLGFMPEKMAEITLELGEGNKMLYQILKSSGLTTSTSEGMRAISQGGVRIDGNRVSDKGLELKPGTYVLQVGKRRFIRATLS